MITGNQLNDTNEISSLMEISDIEWGKRTIVCEPLFEKRSDEEQTHLIRCALENAEQEVAKLRSKHGVLLPHEYAARLFVNVKDDRSAIRSPFLYFATYVEQPPTISLAINAFRMIAEELGHNAELPKKLFECDLREMAIAHELFHYLQTQNPEMFVCTKNVEVVTLFGLIKYKATSRSLEEIAGRHFSKLLMGIDFSPTIYESILWYADKRISMEEKKADPLRRFPLTEKIMAAIKSNRKKLRRTPDY